MTEATASPTPVKRRRWLRLFSFILLGWLLLLLIVSFVATSSFFFEGAVLPRVSKAVNATITVGSASISPFSQVVLRGLKVQTTGPDTLLTAREARVRYSLRDIIGGKINVGEVILDSPSVQIVENADGTSNLDP